MSAGEISPIICDQPPTLAFVERVEDGLLHPSAEGMLIEFRTHPEADIVEVDQILADDAVISPLRVVLRKMEQQTSPVIALVPKSLSLLQFEIALACHARFIDGGKVSFCFPWHKYGLMPVLGGSQRLPRLIGIKLAAQILLDDERLAAGRLAAAGLFIRAGSSLRAAAKEWAAENSSYRQPWDRDLKWTGEAYSQTPANRAILQKVYLELRQRIPPEEAAPTAILRCLQEGLERSFDAGIRLEAEAWSSVRSSRSTMHRVKLFRVAQPKARKSLAAKANPFKRVGILGAGQMGTGIACTAARSSCQVVLVDLAQPALDRALNRIQKLADLTGTDRPADLGRLITPSRSIGALASCQFVVEAIFERSDLKKAALAEVSSLLDPQAVLATNTTTLPISDLATAVTNPERFLGTHFFAPADRMELLEIIRGEMTSNQTIDDALQFARLMGKTPVQVQDGPGFFTSRTVMAYLQEALIMLREGMSPWFIDHVAQNAGMLVGPLTIADLTSLDLLANIFESLAHYGRGMARNASDSVEILRQFTARSRLGRKTRAGIYDYDANHERIDWPELKYLFSPRTTEPSPQEVEERLFVSQAVEALHALAEGIIDDPAMADLASVLGWSYPAARGGVLSYIDFVGADSFESTRQKLQQKCGDRFALP